MIKKKQSFLYALSGILFWSLLTSPASAAQPRLFGDNFGINIKSERITEDELDLIAQLGIERVRTSIPWYAVEKQKGDYNWSIAQYRHRSADDYNTRPYYSFDIFINQIISRKLHIDITLHEGNGLYTGEAVNIAAKNEPPSFRTPAPVTPDAINAFANFAAQTVSHYQGRYGRPAFTWHIWNEPDTVGSFAPKVDAGIFGRLMTATCKAIRAIDTSTEVMGPALSAYGDGDIHLDFIDGLFTQSNPLPCLNGFTIHPYRAHVPETAPLTYTEVAKYLAPWQPVNKPAIPVSVDEWGYSNNKSRGTPPFYARWRNFSGEEQAALMLRMVLTNLSAGIPLTIIYDWRDRGTDPYEWEDHFGLMDFYGNDKPALKMFRAIWPLLHNRTLLNTTTPPNCGTHEHAVNLSRRSDTQEWLVLWTDDQPRLLQLSSMPERLIDIYGNKVSADARGRIQLTGSPLLLAYTPGKKPGFACAL